MTAEIGNAVMARLVRQAEPGARHIQAKPERVLRLSLARATKQAVGLDLAVASVAMRGIQLDAGVEDLGGRMMLALERAGGPVGCVALDLQLRTALVEVLTLGQVAAAPAADRPVTVSDGALAQPFVDGFLQDVARSSFETELDTWADGVAVGARFDTVRDVIMALPDRAYRRVDLRVELGSEARLGEVSVLLPDTGVEEEREPGGTSNFAERMSASVMEAEAVLSAVLHRWDVPLSDIEAWRIGQVVPLAGVTVGSVRLESLDETVVATARLGQSSGLRAVRVERTQPRDIGDAQLATVAVAELDGVPSETGTMPEDAAQAS